MKAQDLCCLSSSSSSWNNSSKKVTATFLCCILLSSMLLGDAERTCTRIEGTYRDCLCGVMYRDVETHCQDEDTYYLPELSQQNLSCHFSCLNGGILDQNNCICNAVPGAPRSHGLCCEVRKSSCMHVHVATTHAHRPWHVHGNMTPALFTSMRFVAACMLSSIVVVLHA